MRKLLLASGALIGGLASGQVMAQTTTPAPGPLPPTWSEGSIPTAPSGIAGPNSNLNAQGYYTKGPMPAPTPGSIVVHLNGRVTFYGFAVNQTSDSYGGRKAQPYGTLGYVRLFPGVDGMTTGGLRYGASAEIREQFSETSASTTSGGASGANLGSQTQTIAAGGTYQPGNYLYVRRAFMYLGGDWGAVHLGQDDGPLALLDAGVTTFQTYNNGGLNDDLNQGTGSALPDMPTWSFPSSAGNEYTTSKIVYLSPQIAGFDFAGSFEPDDNPLQDDVGAATAYSPQISTGITGGEIARRRNTVEIGGRYQGAVGPAGLYAFVGYMGSSKVNVGVGAPDFNYDNLSLVNGGVAVNFGGLRVGGSLLTGQGNSGLGLKIDGQANIFAYLLGTQYTFGPTTVGASYENIVSGGAASPSGTPLGSQRREGALNVGGTYVVAPGLIGYLSATYGQRYQGGWNFNTSAVGPSANNVKFEAIGIGGMVRW